MRGYDSIDSILEELARAEELHPNWPEDVIHQAAIVAEEAGEAVQAALDVHYKGRPIAALRRELVQTGAMVLRALIGLEGRA